MPFENIWIKKGVYKRFFGTVTPQEFQLSMELIHGDPRFDDMRWSVNDFTSATVSGLTEEHVEQFIIPGIGAAYTNPRVTIHFICNTPLVLELTQRYARAVTCQLQVHPSRVAALAAAPDVMSLCVEHMKT